MTTSAGRFVIETSDDDDWASAITRIINVPMTDSHALDERCCAARESHMSARPRSTTVGS